MASGTDRGALPIPLTIVTGFLGSGKTTLINYMLEDNRGRERIAIVKNEIGDVAVDSKIIRGRNIVMKELLYGCVCCTLVGEFEESLRELVGMVKLDRIVVETSGAANPAILAVNIDRLDFVRRDLIVTVIDVLHFPGYKDKTIVARLQHKFTDLVVLNRIGTVGEEVVERILDDIYEQRPGIPVARTETGRVPLEILFGATIKHLSHNFLVSEPLESGHLELDGIEFFSLTLDEKMDLEELKRVLGGLSDEYYRVKGMVADAKDGNLYLVNWVCGRLNLEIISHIDVKETSLVFIGKRVGRYKNSIKKRLMECKR